MNQVPTRVLVVEDDLDLREILEDFLTSEGHEVRTAANGAEALRVLDESPSSRYLILLDMMLPVMDGRTLMTRLKTRTPQHPVLMLSADESLHTEMRSANHRLLPKPFDLHALRAAVAQLA